MSCQQSTEPWPAYYWKLIICLENGSETDRIAFGSLKRHLKNMFSKYSQLKKWLLYAKDTTNVSTSKGIGTLRGPYFSIKPLFARINLLSFCVAISSLCLSGGFKCAVKRSAYPRMADVCAVSNKSSKPPAQPSSCWEPGLKHRLALQWHLNGSYYGTYVVRLCWGNVTFCILVVLSLYSRLSALIVSRFG